MFRIAVFVTAAAGIAAAQDARSVLDRIASNARSAPSWRLAGSIRTTVGMRGESTYSDVAFRALSQVPGRLRYEIPGGRKAGLLVCSESEGWTLLPGAAAKPMPAGNLCPGSATGWESLTEDLLSAEFDGSSTMWSE